MEIHECERINLLIYIAGDINVAKQAAREFCWDFGWCVTVTPTTFIYSGGEEDGVIIGVESYPRFPSSDITLMEKTEHFADILARRLCQKTYMICSKSKAKWYVRDLPFVTK